MRITINVRTGDAGWDESKHKRAADGKFGSGGGGKGKKKADEPKAKAGKSEEHQKILDEGFRYAVERGFGDDSSIEAMADFLVGKAGLSQKQANDLAYEDFYSRFKRKG